MANWIVTNNSQVGPVAQKYRGLQQTPVAGTQACVIVQDDAVLVSAGYPPKSFSTPYSYYPIKAQIIFHLKHSSVYNEQILTSSWMDDSFVN